MSNKELSRLELIQKLIERRLTQTEVAEILKISTRQVQRLIKSYRSSGANGLVSKKRGKPSNNVISGGDKTKVLAIITEYYSDFGPTLAAEKLLQRHNYGFSVETVRKWMIESALWIPREQKLKRAHQPRYRRNCLGELVQIDGSYHDWFEGRAPKCCLLVFIDDATSKIMQLYFTTSESMHTYFLATKAYVTKHGRPLAFYSDKLGVFRVAHKEAAEQGAITQFGRALQELDIQLICANTCQAKGRVERANKTLQDRLVKELRLKNISSIAEANVYLNEFTRDHNAKFAKAPLNSTNMHRILSPHMILNGILCFQTTRTVSHNLTFQHNRQLFLLEDNTQTRALRRKQITLCEYPEGLCRIWLKPILKTDTLTVG
ncbi:MAG: ISNCY family transposase, partial [Pseudomonadota bacterium]